MKNTHIILIIFLFCFLFKKAKSEENFTSYSYVDKVIGDMTVNELIAVGDDTISDAFWTNTDQMLGRPCRVFRNDDGVVVSDACNDNTYCDGKVGDNGGAGLCNYRTDGACWVDLENEQDSCPLDRTCVNNFCEVPS